MRMFRPKLPPPPGSANGSANGSAGGPADRTADGSAKNRSAGGPEKNGAAVKKAGRGAYEERVKRLVEQTGAQDGAGALSGGEDEVPLFDDASPGVNRLASVMVWGFVALCALGLLYAVLIAHTIFFPGAGSSSGTDGSSGQGREADVLGAEERQAASVAENFARAYLTQHEGEDAMDAQRMIAPYVVTSSELSLDSVAPRVSGDTTREVLASAAYRVIRLQEGRYAVYTDNLTTDGPDSADTRREGLVVYVGGSPAGSSAGDASGGDFAVVAPPQEVRLPSVQEVSQEVSTGALYGSSSYALTDRALSSLLEGYFAAAYGSDASRGSLRQFFAPGARLPDQPAAGLSYLSLLQGATLYPTRAQKGYDRAYKVEAYVSVKDERTGQSENQTHLLTVAHESGGGGWLITGSPAAP